MKFNKGYKYRIYPFYRTSDVGLAHLSDNLTQVSDWLNKEGIKGLKLFKKGTILFPKSGDSTFLNHRVIMGLDGYVASHLATISVEEEKANIKYVYNLLTQIDAKRLTPDQAYPSLKTSEIAKIKIPLPPLSDQKEIVEEIEGYQKIIDRAKAVVENWKPVIKIDEDWEMVELGKVCDVISGYSFKSEDFSDSNFVKSIKITNVGVKEFVETTTDLLPKEFIEKYSKYIVKKDNIVIALTCPYISTGLKVSIVPESYDSSLLNQRVACIKEIESKSNLKYIYYLLSMSFVLDYIIDKSRSLNQPNLSIKDLNSLKIPLPDINIQEKIVEEIEEENKIIEANKRLTEIYEQKIKVRLLKYGGSRNVRRFIKYRKIIKNIK